MDDEESTAKPWELPVVELIDDSNHRIRASELHMRYYDFVGRRIAKQATDDDAFDMNFIAKTYAGIIQSKKSGELYYIFNPRTLWVHLVQKKWVFESYHYYTVQLKDQRARLGNIVDPFFKELAEMDDDTIKSIASSRPL